MLKLQTFMNMPVHAMNKFQTFPCCFGEVSLWFLKIKVSKYIFVQADFSSFWLFARIELQVFLSKYMLIPWNDLSKAAYCSFLLHQYVKRQCCENTWVLHRSYLYRLSHSTNSKKKKIYSIITIIRNSFWLNTERLNFCSVSSWNCLLQSHSASFPTSSRSQLVKPHLN